MLATIAPRVHPANLTPFARVEAAERWLHLQRETNAYDGTGFTPEEIAEHLEELHADLASYLGLTASEETPERMQGADPEAVQAWMQAGPERPVVDLCICHAYFLVTAESATLTGWDGNFGWGHPAPHCGCRS
jgi:hypothetical protein